MTDTRLAYLRKQIADTDKQILDLIKNRMDLCEQVGEHKVENKLPIKDYGVEKQIIEKARQKARDMDLYEDLVEAIYLTLIKYSVIKQDELVRTAGENLASKGTKTLVIGGHGHMGRWLSLFFESMGHEVCVFDKNKNSSLPNSVVDVTDFKRAVTSSDYIVLATPMSTSSDLIYQITDLKPKGLLIDICSLKSPVEDSIRHAIKNGVRVSSIHPMFGPSLQVLAGKNIIVCTGEGLETEDVLTNLLGSTSAKVVKIDFSDHDQLMSYVLGATHFVNIAFANFVSSSGFSWDEIRSVAGTTFQEQMQVSKEVIDENQDLYFEIQDMNKQSAEVIRRLNNTIQYMQEALAKSSVCDFKKFMEDARIFFAGESD